jgi:response regulator of citrate/malate metabolism
MHDIVIDQWVSKWTLPLADPKYYEQYVADNLDLIAFARTASQHATGSPEGISEWTIVHIVKVLQELENNYERQ